MLESIINHPIAIAFAIAFLFHTIPELLTKAQLLASEFMDRGTASGLGLTFRFVFGCLKCCTWWSVLFVTGSVLTAALAALVIYLISRN